LRAGIRRSDCGERASGRPPGADQCGPVRDMAVSADAGAPRRDRHAARCSGLPEGCRFRTRRVGAKRRRNAPLILRDITDRIVRRDDSRGNGMQRASLPSRSIRLSIPRYTVHPNAKETRMATEIKTEPDYDAAVAALG